MEYNNKRNYNYPLLDIYTVAQFFSLNELTHFSIPGVKGMGSPAVITVRYCNRIDLPFIILKFRLVSPFENIFWPKGLAANNP
jgi:hypothetical protein